MMNHLNSEKSPYLLQHAENPVDWYPWSDEAFARAEKEQKPIFLSIGYSTCHWCHVMAHESFEDRKVAALMNDIFVNIKVDREERPDIDQVYMTVCQMVTGGGGWPLTIMMTPDKKPFFAATYIPKSSRQGRSGLLDLLPRVKELWNDRRDELLESAQQITQSLQTIGSSPGNETLEEPVLDIAFEQLEQRYDARWGGFGQAPKFPMPHNLLFLLRYARRYNSDHAVNMVQKTLKAMRQGGIWDHVGYGLHRYSTDRSWLLPHFEKMLYDQALYLFTLSEAFQLTGDEMHRETAEQLVEFILREMTHDQGGFYSAQDADSEGEEGKFYVWSWEELESILSSETMDFMQMVFQVRKEGNFADEASGERTGHNILHRRASWKKLAQDLQKSETELLDQWQHIRQLLFNYRELRERPLLDDKILTDWNGLLIAALAKASRVFALPKARQAAEKAVQFIQHTLVNEQGVLLHRYRQGKAGLASHADDYAFYIWGLIELYQTTFDPLYLQLASRWQQQMVERFWDREQHGFYFTSHDSEILLVRRIEVSDGAVPSANSVSALNLIRLSRLTGEPSYEERARMLLQRFSSDVVAYPTAHTLMLCVLDFVLGPTQELVVATPDPLTDSPEWLQKLNRSYLPGMVILVKSGAQDKLNTLAPFTKKMKSLDNKTTFYLCRDYHCEQPVFDANALELR
jgi:hypothetical protein